MAAQADVLVEGFRPGVMARLGLDEGTVRAINPGIVYCSISGYGQQDERAALPGHDVNYQAWAGALTPEGGTAHIPAPADGRPGGGADRRLRDLCRRHRARHERRGDVPRRLHDRRDGDVDGIRRCRVVGP